MAKVASVEKSFVALLICRVVCFIPLYENDASAPQSYVFEAVQALFFLHKHVREEACLSTKAPHQHIVFVDFCSQPLHLTEVDLVAKLLVVPYLHGVCFGSKFWNFIRQQ